MQEERRKNEIRQARLALRKKRKQEKEVSAGCVVGAAHPVLCGLPPPAVGAHERRVLIACAAQCSCRLPSACNASAVASLPAT